MKMNTALENTILLHHYFEKNAKSNPDNLAVSDEYITLSYKQLNKRANQLARLLVSEGVDVGDHVAILLNRTADIIVSMLAILKAGGAIVAIDPKYPTDLVNYMLVDSEAKVVLSSTKVKDKFQSAIGDLVLCLDEESTFKKLAKLPDNNSIELSGPFTGDELVYVVYTSGSTGKPKGVKLPHKSIVNVLADQSRGFDVLALPLRSLQYSSISFDVAFHEIITALYTGGSLYIVNEDMRTDFTSLLEFICKNRIERIFMPNPVLQALAFAAIESGISQDLSLKVIVQSGEQLRMSPELTSFLMTTNCQLINQYGPAEAHVVCYYISDEPYDKWPEFPPIGSHIIKNTKLYVLDGNLNEVENGEVGELFIAGIGLANGYQNKTEKTQSHFISNPFSFEEKYNRLYKTGDLVIQKNNGVIEYAGRSDHQVKIRGFRIELSAIESVLLSFSCVKSTVVSAVKLHEGQSEKSLVAHVVTHIPEQSLPHDENELIHLFKSALGERLPDFMMPNIFIFIDALPLSNNGKVNRKALSMPTMEHLLSSNFIPSNGQLEQELLTCYETLLRLKEIGVGLNFLELGGSSLNAMRLNRTIEKTFKCRVGIQDIMTLSIRELALLINNKIEQCPAQSEKIALEKV
ncbi:MAG: non-ribosomal peptide synthetase [Psychrobium sp.]|nr:non-ribosomal peptide synthetase [Psychrobium sp.]